MVLNGRDLKGERLEVRRDLLEQKIIPRLLDPVRYTGELNADLRDLVHSVKTQGLEGLVAKRRDSRYEPGLRSGAWMKMRVKPEGRSSSSAGTPSARRRSMRSSSAITKVTA